MSEQRVVDFPNRGVVAQNLQPINKGALFASVEIVIAAWHMRITCLWMRTEKGEFLSLPSQKFTTRAGQTSYKRLVEFTDKAAFDRFQAAALDAVKRL